MQLLLIHSDLIEYDCLRKVDVSVRDEPKSEHLEEVLVVFTSCEKGDNRDTVTRAAAEILDLVSTVKAGRILIYPYAHLSSNLASPPIALKLLHELEDQLSKKMETHSSPFGWYKSFTIKCKGHPLSELSKHL